MSDAARYVFATVWTIGSFVAVGAYTINNNRKEAAGNIKRIDDVLERYEIEAEDRLKESPNAGEIVGKHLRKDQEWHAREVARQREWLARPTLKQVVPPPFPRYVDL
jgi:hypothetical protein